MRRSIDLISQPSISRLPAGSAILNSIASREDFPAPVLPTIPTFRGGGGKSWKCSLYLLTHLILTVTMYVCTLASEDHTFSEGWI